MRAIKRKDSGAPKSKDGRLSLAPRAPDASAPIASTLASTFTTRLVALDADGRAWIAPEAENVAASEPRPSDDASCAPLGIVARSIVPLSPDQVGREVLACRANRASEPVILGLLQAALPASTPSAVPIELNVERKRIVFAANTEIVLRCGDGSITLSADGKVSIRGLDIVSSATRTQRIRGGAVRIN